MFLVAVDASVESPACYVQTIQVAAIGPDSGRYCLSGAVDGQNASGASVVLKSCLISSFPGW